MWPNPQETADLVTFTEKMELTEKTAAIESNLIKFPDYRNGALLNLFFNTVVLFVNFIGLFKQLNSNLFVVPWVFRDS